MGKNRWLIVFKKINSNKKVRLPTVLLLLVICSLFAMLLVTPSKSFNGYPVFSPDTAPELQEILSRRFSSFSELSDYFRNLSKKKGALYGFQVLRYARLPAQTDFHLLGHTVGDVLYHQQGSEGMANCTDEFRNACSHSIVIGTLLEKGENSLSTLSKICEKAPGGSGAYTMCFHGLGHGVLAYTNYDMERAVAMCKKTGTKEHGNQEYIECVGGTVMEIVGGGDHDKETYNKQVGKYVKKDDPLSPCDSNIIPAEAKFMCYTYITPNLFVQAGADLGNPSPETFPKAFSFCERITGQNDRQACYGGLGKEFVGLANSRDVRNIDQMSTDQLKTVIKWCYLADKREGIDACLRASIQSLFWGGETNPDASFTFCSLLDDKAFRSSCYEDLAGNIRTYIKDVAKKTALCNRLPKDNRYRCYNSK